MTDKRLTNGDVHICITCEHHQFCRIAQVIEQSRSIGGVEIEIPGVGNGFMENPDSPILENDKDWETPVFAGIRVCFRHSSGNPLVTKGILHSD